MLSTCHIFPCCISPHPQLRPDAHYTGTASTSSGGEESALSVQITASESPRCPSFQGKKKVQRARETREVGF